VIGLYTYVQGNVKNNFKMMKNYGQCTIPVRPEKIK